LVKLPNALILCNCVEPCIKLARITRTKTALQHSHVVNVAGSIK